MVVAGRPRVLEGRNAGQRERHRDWRQAVTAAAWEAMSRAREPTPFLGPVEVTALVRMPRPRSTPGNRTWHHRQPDLDKIARSIGDSLEVAGVVASDAQIARWVIEKILCPPDAPLGASITVRPLDHTEPPVAAETRLTGRGGS